MKELTTTMKLAIVLAKEGNGRLIRLPGGFWTIPGEPKTSSGVPQRYLGTLTVQALVKRELATYDEWKEGVSGKFPIGVALKEEPAHN